MKKNTFQELTLDLPVLSALIRAKKSAAKLQEKYLDHSGSSCFRCDPCNNMNLPNSPGCIQWRNNVFYWVLNERIWMQLGGVCVCVTLGMMAQGLVAMNNVTTRNNEHVPLPCSQLQTTWLMARSLQVETSSVQLWFRSIAFLPETKIFRAPCWIQSTKSSKTCSCFHAACMQLVYVVSHVSTG